MDVIVKKKKLVVRGARNLSEGLGKVNILVVTDYLTDKTDRSPNSLNSKEPSQPGIHWGD
jgi:hypothetical protein